MVSLCSGAFEKLMHHSARLRAQARFQQAIELVESNLPTLDDDCLENSYLELIYAAREGGRPEVAQKYARLLAAIDPDIPGVKQVLGENP